jgi:hypothetical protein
VAETTRDQSARADLLALADRYDWLAAWAEDQERGKTELTVLPVGDRGGRAEDARDIGDGSLLRKRTHMLAMSRLHRAGQGGAERSALSARSAEIWVGSAASADGALIARGRIGARGAQLAFVTRPSLGLCVFGSRRRLNFLSFLVQLIRKPF